MLFLRHTVFNLLLLLSLAGPSVIDPLLSVIRSLMSRKHTSID